MTLIGWAQIALVLTLVFVAAVPLGTYIAARARGPTSASCGPVERGFYAAAGVDPAAAWAGAATPAH